MGDSKSSARFFLFFFFFMINFNNDIRKHKRVLWNPISTILFYDFLPSTSHLKNSFLKKGIRYSHIEMIKVLFERFQRNELLDIKRIFKWPEKVKVWVSQVWWICFVTQDIIALLNNTSPGRHRNVMWSTVMGDQNTSAISQFWLFFFDFCFENCCLRRVFFWIYCLIWW